MYRLMMRCSRQCDERSQSRFILDADIISKSIQPRRRNGRHKSSWTHTGAISSRSVAVSHSFISKSISANNTCCFSTGTETVLNDTCLVDLKGKNCGWFPVQERKNEIPHYLYPLAHVRTIATVYTHRLVYTMQWDDGNFCVGRSLCYTKKHDPYMHY